MDIQLILKGLFAVITVGLGVGAMIKPLAIRSFTGLDVSGPRGVTEIRAVLGGAFIGLGAAPLALNDPVAYQMLGIVYLVIGVVRLIGMIIDKSMVSSNIVSVGYEALAGFILIL